MNLLITSSPLNLDLLLRRIECVAAFFQGCCRARSGFWISYRLDVRPFFKDEITIGRGSRHVAVDLRLEGDLEVSRQLATFAKQGDEYTVTCKGANPIVINDGREVSAGETAPLKPGDKIAVCSYELIIV